MAWTAQTDAGLSSASDPGSWSLGPGSGCTYGIPAGCVVKNTFLDWPELERQHVAFGSADLTEAQLAFVAVRPRRSRSCPGLRPKAPEPVGGESVSTRSPTASPIPEEVEPEAGCDETQDFAWQDNSWAPWRSRAPAPSLVLRGLPFNTSEVEILQFVKRSGVPSELLAERPVVMLTNAQGRPSGFAEIHLQPGADSAQVQERLHMKHLGGRYIEVLPLRQSKKMGARRVRDRDGPRSWRGR